MAASLEPVVEQPWVLAASGEFHRSASVLVDHVFVDAFVHQLANFRLNPRLAKSRKVLPGVSIEQKLIMHQLIRCCRTGFRHRKTGLGQRMRKEARFELLVLRANDEFSLRMRSHKPSPSPKRCR
jgi:hypothetical protein